MAVDRENHMQTLKQPAQTNGYPVGRSATQIVERVAVLPLSATVGKPAAFNAGLEGAS